MITQQYSDLKNGKPHGWLSNLKRFFVTKCNLDNEMQFLLQDYSGRENWWNNVTVLIDHFY